MLGEFSLDWKSGMERRLGSRIQRHGKQWLVTASHVVEDVDADSISISYRGDVVTTPMTPIPMTQIDSDIAVFSCEGPLTADLPLAATSNSIESSAPRCVYFLGFPYGLALRAGLSSLPFVKHGIVSAFETHDTGLRVWYLDAQLNTGFSGGPVVFNRAGTPRLASGRGDQPRTR